MDPDHGDPLPEKSGIDIIDVTSGERTTIVTLSEIAKIEPVPAMRGAFHYVSHCKFSPSGTRFFVFHLWLYGDNRLGSRLLTYSSGGSEPHVVPTAGMSSHATWRDDGTILAYAREKTHGDGYYLYEDRSSKFQQVAKGQLIGDGHPSISPDRRWLVTDTYPDRFRRRHLVLFDLATKCLYTLALLYSPREFSIGELEGMLRCDLHPRWDRQGRMVCFDSAHSGRRALCIMDVGDLGAGPAPRSLPIHARR